MPGNSRQPGRRLTPGLQAAAEKVLKAVQESVNGRGNSSTMLVGPRGCGKSEILDWVMDIVAVTTIVQELDPKPIVLKLAGLVHADDERGAFSALAAQLSIGADKTANAAAPRLLNLVNEALSRGSAAGRSFLVTFDDFDLFTTQPKPTVLYGVLNLLQSTEVNMAVVGLTIRYDAAEKLEKRVKSRFSQRLIVVPRPSTVEEVEAVLTWRLPDYVSNERNKHVIEAQLKEDRVVGSILMRASFDPDDLSSSSQFLQVGSDAEEVLIGLSALEFALLVSYRRLVMRKGGRTYGFREVFDELSSIHGGEGATRARNAFNDEGISRPGALFTRHLAWKAWNGLLDLELLTLADGEAHLGVELDEIRAAMDKHPGVGAFLRSWGLSFIT